MTDMINHVDLLERILSAFAVADEHSGQRHDNQLAKLLVGRGVRVDADAAAALDAAAARDTEAEELARVIGHAASGVTWSVLDNNDQGGFLYVAGKALDHLGERGRLTPEGGTVLTADEVADVRWVLACGGVGSVVSDRLRARFAPVEPAAKQEPRTTEPWDRWQDVPNGVKYRSRDSHSVGGWWWINRNGIRYTENVHAESRPSETHQQLMAERYAPFVEVPGGAQ